ncbi:MAG: hypothetical protein JO255_03830 [Alphaproteobacteria bacterium]|nr:hypothetical protein [Alphaproteobacteria bacterium]
MLPLRAASFAAMEPLPLTDDLHRSIWFTYRRAIGADASWDAAAAFQVAVDVYLRNRPGTHAALACREAARMIMTRPRGIANRGRIVSGGSAAEAARRERPRRAALVAVGYFPSARVAAR